MTNNPLQQAYGAPQVEIIEVEVENGFCVSGGEPQDYEWGDHFTN